MIRHYNDLIYSVIVEDGDYVFENLAFGRSNTDQSYYEPMASMIQNMQKTGSVSSSLHNDAEKSIKEIRDNSSFLPNYLTLEEVNSMIVEQKNSLQESIDDFNNQLIDIKDHVNEVNQLTNALVEQKSTDLI